MIDDTVAGPTSSMAAHCSSKSMGTASAASGGIAGPHWPRNSLTRASRAMFRRGGGSGIHRFIWNAPFVCARTSAAHARIASGFISNAPQPPRPPALATAIASEAGQAPAIGAMRIGRRIWRASQKARARASGANDLVTQCGLRAELACRAADIYRSTDRGRGDMLSSVAGSPSRPVPDRPNIVGDRRQVGVRQVHASHRGHHTFVRLRFGHARADRLRDGRNAAVAPGPFAAGQI
jgi:hypothetical protein